MKQFFLFLISAIISAHTFAQNSLTGKVTDPKAGPLEGAIVYINDLKVGAATHADGSYAINGIPKGTYLIEVRYLGYTRNTQTVKVDGAVTLDIAMSPSAYQENEVVVTGNYAATASTQNPQQTSEISNEYLAEHSATNVIDAIALAPGVAGMTDGQSITKPIIRGLGYNRVVTVNDGVVQEDQAWFDEFGIEADPDAVERAEILKGPASLAYGSDAIAGVVNLIPERPLPEGQVKGDIMSNYQTNNGLIGNAVHVAGTNNGISWSGRIDYTMAHAYQNAVDGYALNTQFNNFNTDATLGIHRKWGYSQLHGSYFQMSTGILDGTRDSITGQQLLNVAFPGVSGTNQASAGSAFPIAYANPGGGPNAPFYVAPTLQQQKSYTPFVINQLIRHKKIVWDNSVSVGKGRITMITSWQLNQRQETNNPSESNTPDIYYYSNAATYDLRYISQNYKGFDFSTGVNGAVQLSESRGTLMLIPNYNIFQGGAFFIGNYKYKKLTVSGGVRYDIRYFQAKDHWVDSTTQEPVAPDAVNGFHEFTGFTTTFKGLSASLGLTYALPKNLYIKFNEARGFRAPSVVECAANGVHDGTVVWELGNASLKPETSYESDLSFGMNGKDVGFELDGFANYINDFIYAVGLNSVFGGDSINNTLNLAGLGAAPVFKYTQGNALLYGGEAVLDIHPSAASWFDFYGTASIVEGGLLGVPDSIKILPFVPPMRFTGDIKIYLNKFAGADKLNKGIKNFYIRFGAAGYTEQRNIYLQSAIYTGLNTASTPQEYAASRSAQPGYVLFNVGAGGDLQSSKGHTFAKLYLMVNNLFNTTYMDYMSRYKYYPANLATGRVGVFNMGRNISIKVIIPINIKG